MAGKREAKRKRHPVRTVLLLLLVLLIAGTGAFGIYVGQYYHADEEALAVLAAESDGTGVTAEQMPDGSMAFVPETPLAGLFFYPGAKVEHTAYAPLMRSLAEQGVLCVLVEMPFRLAVLSPDVAEGIPEQFPEVKDWYIGGHSLGGAMAARYAARHPEDLKGLLLLAAYSTEKLPDTGLAVLSLYGSEDEVLNMESYEKYRGNLPADAAEYEIPGGCHAGFGSYGPQKGDGTPAISAEEQREITVEKSMEELFRLPEPGEAANAA